MNTGVTLPKKHKFDTPRMLVADAYTVGGDLFQNPEAGDKSVYYITFRRELHKSNPYLYKKGDDRLIFVGLQDILEYLLILDFFYVHFFQPN